MSILEDVESNRHKRDPFKQAYVHYLLQRSLPTTEYCSIEGDDCPSPEGGSGAHLSQIESGADDVHARVEVSL